MFNSRCSGGRGRERGAGVELEKEWNFPRWLTLRNTLWLLWALTRVKLPLTVASLRPPLLQAPPLLSSENLFFTPGLGSQPALGLNQHPSRSTFKNAHSCWAPNSFCSHSNYRRAMIDVLRSMDQTTNHFSINTESKWLNYCTRLFFFLQHLDIQFLPYYYTINGNDRNESVVPCLKILSKNYNLSIWQLIAFRDAVPKITIFGTYVWVTPTEIELEGMLFFTSLTRTILNPLLNENSKDFEKMYPCEMRRTPIS